MWRPLAGVVLIGLSSIMHCIAQGRVVLERPVFSKHLDANRMVRIYLPAGYESAPERRYPVLYLHDGQNAFTTVGTNVAFGWGNWELDKTVNELCAAGRMREIIMVAVDCSAERYLDYRGPANPETGSGLTGTTQASLTPGGRSRYERYSMFLIEELKPMVDREYRTLGEAANTGVLGSSMGGICSIALAWEHPDIFGNAASLSGAFQVERSYFLTKVLRAYRGPPKPVRIYLDSGTCDFSGGDDGRRRTDEVAGALRRIGWKEGVDLRHFVDLRPLAESQLEQTGLRRDKWKEAKTSQHNEFYWRLRAWRALEFLFPPK